MRRWVDTVSVKSVRGSELTFISLKAGYSNEKIKDAKKAKKKGGKGKKLVHAIGIGSIFYTSPSLSPRFQALFRRRKTNSEKERIGREKKGRKEEVRWNERSLAVRTW